MNFILMYFLRNICLFALAIGLVFSSLAHAAGTAEQIISLKLIMGDPEDSEMGILGIAFKNFAAQYSNGHLHIELSYGDGLDADETYYFHRVQTGRLDMAIGGVGNLAPMAPRLGVVTLPYLFPDIGAVVAGTTGKAAELLNKYAQEHGLRILAWTYYGFRFLSNSKHPVKRMEDLHGLRMRVPQSLVMIKTYRAFGALPLPVAWPMTRAALKNDLIDGQCYNYSGFRAMKFRDAGQKFITELHYLYNLQPLVINNKIFSKLSSADQDALLKAGQQVQELSLRYQEDMNAVARRVLQKQGVQITALDDESAWRTKAIQEVWPLVVDHLGGEKALNEYLQACKLPLWQSLN